jgi:hypothetical protein
MLEKKKGYFRVDKLNAILLYEANFNQNNKKKLGRDMMYTAEQLQVVAKEQYRSRKNKAAIEQCLNKRPTFDLARQLKRPLAMCSNDAKLCYDRIVHSVASLCMRRKEWKNRLKPSSPYPHRVRRFQAHIFRPTMDSAYPRIWSRKRCRPANLGSSQYPRPQHVAARG